MCIEIICKKSEFWLPAPQELGPRVILLFYLVNLKKIMACTKILEPWTEKNGFMTCPLTANTVLAVSFIIRKEEEKEHVFHVLSTPVTYWICN